jgi:hypothetical protein
MLTDSLFQGFFHVRSFTLNDAKWNAVNEQYQIGSVMLFTGASHYAEFFGYMKYIVADVFPVDILKCKTFFVAIYTLFQCLT